MSDSQPMSQESTQTLDDSVNSPNAASPPNLEGSDYEIEDDASFQENEDGGEGETLQPDRDQEDDMTRAHLPPAGATPVNTTAPNGIANPATSPSMEESLANITRSLENVNGLLKGVLEMVITQNMQSGMMMHEILKVLLHQMPDAILDIRAKIRVKLGHENFSKFQDDSACELATKRLRDAGPPWNMISDLRPVGNKMLLLTVIDEVWEDKIRLEAGRLATIIGLDPDWTVAPKRYCVKVAGYSCGHGEHPRMKKGIWSVWNGVDIADAFVLWNTLVLCMESQEDAQKLWKSNGVVLGRTSSPLPVEPVDLRSFNLWCKRCNKPSHLRHECRLPTQCGKCAGSHDTTQCMVQSSSYRCVNCPGNHRSTSTDCKNSEVVRMLKECEKWRKAGPSWARAVQQPQLPDQALLSRLRTYRNTPAGRAFLDTYRSAPEPGQSMSNQASANAGAATATQPATNPKKRKGNWDSRDELSKEPPTLMQFSQMNQRKLDQANKANRGSRPAGRGRPRGGSARGNLYKRRRGN